MSNSSRAKPIDVNLGLALPTSGALIGTISYEQETEGDEAGFTINYTRCSVLRAFGETKDASFDLLIRILEDELAKLVSKRGDFK